MPVKILFDVEQLASAEGKGTGIMRVAHELLKALCNSNDFDVYPLVTIKKGNVFNYLEVANLDKLKNKVVYMPNLRRTMKCGKWHKLLLAKILTQIYTVFYRKTLNRFDAYMSVFSPISPIVYKSGVKTYLFVHDLIPVYAPQYCGTKFVAKYTSWMKNIQADVVFCDSEYTKKDLLKFRPDLAKAKIEVVYLGADKLFYPVKDKAELNAVKDKYKIKTKKYFLAVSALTARKNFVHLLNAFVLFLSENKDEDVSLVLVGPPQKGYDEIIKTVSSLGDHQNKIVCTGFADDKDMAALYSGATAFIYPSLYEGFGLPILEAMQCGTPVISTDNTSLPEVGGNATVYISGRDIKETAEQLGKIYFNPEYAKELSERSILQARKFSWDKFTDQVITQLKGE